MKKRSFKKWLTKYLIRTLKKERVKNVKIKNGWISLEYDGEKIRNKIVIKKHEPYVGSWAKTKDEVYIDDDLKNKKDMSAVALHECIEKFVTQKYGLPEDTISHDIANEKEKEYLARIDGPWEKHQRKVDKVWRKEGEK